MSMPALRVFANVFELGKKAQRQKFAIKSADRQMQIPFCLDKICAGSMPRLGGTRNTMLFRDKSRKTFSSQRPVSEGTLVNFFDATNLSYFVHSSY